MNLKTTTPNINTYNSKIQGESREINSQDISIETENDTGIIEQISVPGNIVIISCDNNTTTKFNVHINIEEQNNRQKTLKLNRRILGILSPSTPTTSSII